MSSTYYEYREVKVMIAHRLMAMEGWKVYGYSADDSDLMTDYYSPAHWDGVAEKNGYVLVIDKDYKREAEEIRKYNHHETVIDSSTRERIQKLAAFTQERGASESEEQTAKEKIKLLQQKGVDKKANIPKYEVLGLRPAHEANPPKCNWHIEKDGVIILKGSGLLKFAQIYYNDWERTKKQFNVDVEALANEYMEQSHYSSRDKALKAAIYHKEQMDEKKVIFDEFDKLIHKFDTTCGAILGEGELVTYERVKVTEYKKENKAVECTGSLKEGQHFIVKSSGFNYEVCKGYVYVIHEHKGTNGTYFIANRLDGKLRKELTGKANRANSWGYITEGKSLDNFNKWINSGSLAFCKIEEVKTPYEVEKVVKKVLSTEATAKEPASNLHYDIKEDVDTRNNSKIYVVKVVEKLERDSYLEVNNQMQQIGGYYSKFKHGFLFKEDPTKVLSI